MLINEVSKITGLTKKAVEYYTSQGLVSPSILDNGYRDYSVKDIEVLNKIFVLRKLDVSTDEIRKVLSDESNIALQVISVQKELDLQRDEAKKAIIDELSRGKSYFDVIKKLQAIDNSKTITEKLLEAFPGYYGRFICLHFARFLNEPIKTESQQSAYNTIISFLDNIPSPAIPEDLQTYFIEYTKHIGTDQIAEILENSKKSIENPDDFLTSNKEMLEQYLAYKKSDEYKMSPAYKIMELMRSFNETSGYYDIFIPALKKLSDSYSRYYKNLEIANEKFLEQYPDIEKING